MNPFVGGQRLVVGGQNPMAKDDLAPKLLRLNQVILGGFVAVTMALVFWSVVRSEAILAREDNPRLVEAELRIQRGQIFDRNDLILAETVGPPDQLERVYPIPQIGPAVGYYSFRHGTAGVEESFNTQLRQGETDGLADWMRQTLHRPLSGWDVRLTLDATWQTTADSLLPNQPAALLLLELSPETGYADILALVSHPGYNPNQLEDQFDALTQDESAPLLNRVTQGQYQPGLTLQPLLLAGGVEQQLIALNDTPDDVAQQVIVLNGTGIRCLSQPPTLATWVDVLQSVCPAPMQTLADQLGITGLDRVFADFRLMQPPTLPLDTETAESPPIANPLLAGIGQDTLTVTPLQLGLAWAALAGDGRIPTPRLVTATRDNSDLWQPVQVEAENPVAITTGTAVAIRQALPRYENILEHSALVLSGPEGSTNTWYLGMSPTIQPRYVVVVVVEKSEDITAVKNIGRAVLSLISSQ